MGMHGSADELLACRSHQSISAQPYRRIQPSGGSHALGHRQRTHACGEWWQDANIVLQDG
eukprot:scaffold17023_cov32-Tisochrysis_lutea.AAC.2